MTPGAQAQRMPSNPRHHDVHWPPGGRRRHRRARAFAEQADIPRAYDNFEAMLEEEAVDLVSIATPPNLHAAMIKSAAEHGCHVICEKPLALTLAEAEEMAHAMQARGLVHAVTHQFRYFPGIAAFKREVSRGVLGDVRVVRLLSLTDARATPEKSGYSWWSDRTAGGGVLGAVTSHWIDILTWCFGEPRDTVAQLSTFVGGRPDETGVLRSVETEDTATVVLRLGPAGVHATIDVSMVVGPSIRLLEAYGTRGSLVVDGDELRFAPAGEAYVTIAPAQPMYPPSESRPSNVSAFAELAHNVRAAIDGRPHEPFPTFTDGVTVQRILDAAQSAPR